MLNLQAAVEVAATLLHCNASELVAALCTRRIRAGGDTIVQKLTLAQVMLLILDLTRVQMSIEPVTAISHLSFGCKFPGEQDF